MMKINKNKQTKNTHTHNKCILSWSFGVCFISLSLLSHSAALFDAAHFDMVRFFVSISCQQQSFFYIYLLT